MILKVFSNLNELMIVQEFDYIWNLGMGCMNLLILALFFNL